MHSPPQEGVWPSRLGLPAEEPKAHCEVRSGPVTGFAAEMWVKVAHVVPSCHVCVPSATECDMPD